MDIPGDNQLTYIYFTWLKKGPDWSISPYFLLPYISHFTSHYLCVCLAALCQQIFEQKKLFYKKHKKTALRKLEVYLYNLNLRCGIPLILYIYIYFTACYKNILYSSGSILYYQWNEASFGIHIEMGYVKWFAQPHI